MRAAETAAVAAVTGCSWGEQKHVHKDRANMCRDSWQQLVTCLKQEMPSVGSTRPMNGPRLYRSTDINSRISMSLLWSC